MGFFKQIAKTAGEKLLKSKEEIEQEKSFVRNNEGSEAICAYIRDLFEKGNVGYNWVKENKMGLYPVIYNNSVALCYMQTGGLNATSFSEAKAKDVEVANYTFQEMYDWYGLSSGIGYTELSSQIQKNTLEHMIDTAVQELPHIKYNIGYVVKMFQ